MPSQKNYTLSNYLQLIERFKVAGYTFSPYSSDGYTRKSVLLRHDIDYTLSYAETFARINAEAEVAGTFFLQLRSRLYNLLDHDVLSAVRRIIDLGQNIGFHVVVDSKFSNIEELRTYIAAEFALFKSIVPESMPVFAWHNPSILKSEGFNFIQAEFPWLINAYGKIGGVNPPYYADSNMRYSFQELCDIADRDHPVLQLAIAPMQWCPEQPNMRDVMVANLLRKLKDVEPGFLENYVYKDMFPQGIPDDIRQQFGRLCQKVALSSVEGVR